MTDDPTDGGDPFWSRPASPALDLMLLLGRTVIGLGASAFLVTLLAAIPYFLGSEGAAPGIVLLLSAALSMACTLAGAAFTSAATRERIHAMEREALLEEVQEMMSRLEERIDHLDLKVQALALVARRSPEAKAHAYSEEEPTPYPPPAPLAAAPPGTP